MAEAFSVWFPIVWSMVATIFGAASFIFDYLRVMKPRYFPAIETEDKLGEMKKTNRLDRN